MNKRSGGTLVLIAVALAALVLDRVVEWRAGPTAANGGQTGIADYEEARPLLWRQVYAEGGRTLYCGQAFGADYNPGLNIEHVFPMSWVTNALDCGRRKACRRTSDRFNQIEADLHNLFPSRTEMNKARGAMPFGDIPGERRRFGECDFEVDEDRRIVEPRPGARGEIARAMFYMRNTYGLVLFDDFGRRLKQWHRDDPVSDAERRRNDAIEQIQGTRNPYIDQPELVEEIEFR